MGAGFAAGKAHAGRIYNKRVEDGGLFPDTFVAQIISAGARARLDTLKAGVPVFYWDWKSSVDVMELPDGRRFEVSFIAGAPGESNYRVIRQLDDAAAA